MSTYRKTATLLIPTLVSALGGGCSSPQPGRPSGSASGPSTSGQEAQPALRPCNINLSPIAPGRLGVLRVGMTTDELRATCRGAVPIAGTDEEGSPLTLYALPVSNRDTVFADLDTVRSHTVVRTFTIGFTGPRTDDGLGV